MALSDRIALLRNGALEQVGFAIATFYHAFPRPPPTRRNSSVKPICCAPSSANRVADCGAFQFPCGQEDGSALFLASPRSQFPSLVIIRTAEASSAATRRSSSFRLAATIHQQIYSGATEPPRTPNRHRPPCSAPVLRHAPTHGRSRNLSSPARRNPRPRLTMPSSDLHFRSRSPDSALFPGFLFLNCSLVADL